jgi:2'-5' RNA ligase
VAKERLKSPRVRLFVALDLPQDLRAELEAWQARECTDPALRPVPAEHLHVTLCFLGWQRERDAAPIAEIVTGVAARRVELQFEPEPLARPPKGRPRLFALGAKSSAAVELQAELAERLEQGGYFKPEKRPFWPHLTVARVKRERAREGSGRRRRGGYRKVAEPPGPLSQAGERPFDAVRIALYRSDLRPEGAEYTSLATMELPPVGGREVN